MNIKLILFRVSLFILLASCKLENNNDFILEKSVQKFKTLKLDDENLKIKRVDSIYYGNDLTYYSYRGSNKNLNVYTSFDIYVNNQYNFSNYSKVYLDSINYHYLHKISDTDTLYYFQINRYVPQFRYFILGKYNFYYKYGFFNKKQKSLYKKYKDSLSKVRGNVKLFEGLSE
jgi:hypothetical protein